MIVILQHKLILELAFHKVSLDKIHRQEFGKNSPIFSTRFAIYLHGNQAIFCFREKPKKTLI